MERNNRTHVKGRKEKKSSAGSTKYHQRYDGINCDSIFNIIKDELTNISYILVKEFNIIEVEIAS